MKVAKFDNIVALKTESGKLIGFHTRNMQVAQIDEAVWQTIAGEADDRALPEADLAEIRDEIRQEIATWSSEVDPRATDADLPQEVRNLIVNVAQVCNLKCGYCAAGGDGTYGDPMKHVELESIYEQLRTPLHDVRSGETFSITFFGGEPLVAPDVIRQLARFARLQVAGRGIDLQFAIITNGTLITPASAELLASLKAHVTISIDGPPEVNDKSRPTPSGRGSTLLTLQGIQNLMRVRDRLGRLKFASVFGSHNSDVLATYEFLRNYDFDLYKFDFAAGDGDADASEAYSRSLAATADRAMELGGEAELRKISAFDGYFRVLDEQRRVHNFCGAGKTHMAMDGRGRTAACHWFLNRPAEELSRPGQVHEDRIAKYAGRIGELNDCGSCWARNLCGGGCMFVHDLKTGSKHKKDAVFCGRTRKLVAKALELYATARAEGATSEEALETPKIDSRLTQDS